MSRSSLTKGFLIANNMTRAEMLEMIKAGKLWLLCRYDLETWKLLIRNFVRSMLLIIICIGTNYWPPYFVRYENCARAVVVEWNGLCKSDFVRILCNFIGNLTTLLISCALIVFLRRNFVPNCLVLLPHTIWHRNILARWWAAIWTTNKHLVLHIITTLVTYYNYYELD